MSLIAKMQERFATLQAQLATGQKASTLAEMGSDRYFDLSIRSRINRIEGYKNNIDMVNMRLEVFDQVVSRLDTVESNARARDRARAPMAARTSISARRPRSPRSNLDELVNLLNTDVDGRYLFAGGKRRPAPRRKRPLPSSTAPPGKPASSRSPPNASPPTRATDSAALRSPPAANDVELDEDRGASVRLQAVDAHDDAAATSR